MLPALLLAILPPATPTPVQVWLSAKDTPHRLARQPDASFVPLPQPEEDAPTVFVDPGKTFQPIVGFGGALTDAAAETWGRLSPERRQEVLRAYFDPEQGLGYSLCRVSIHSCDFSSASFTYDDVAGDRELKHFSIEPDRRARLPFIKAALATAPFKVFASPWSPPAWMKTNQNMLLGGKLKAEYASTWAQYMARFVKAYAQEGVPLWGLTVQNEPQSAQRWESCQYTAEEERDFVKHHLGPTLAKEGLSRLNLMIWDHNRGLLYQRAKAVYDDPEASRFVWGAAFHWYVGDHFDNVRQVKEAWPDKALLFSEGCAESFDPTRIHDWQWGEKYGRSILADLRNGSAGWVDWNVLLDERGGPNHRKNFCYAPVHADTRTGQLTFMASYYYLGHFSRFIRPDSRRVATACNDDRLQAVAFLRPDGRTATVVMNPTDQAIAFHLWIGGQAAPLQLPGHSILTALR